MKNHIKILICMLLLSSTSFAQHAHFTTSGTIEFEKKANMYAIISKTIDKNNEAFMTPIFDQYKKNHPQFKSFKSTLTFTNNKTLFVPEPTEMAANDDWFSNNPMATQNNTIYSDLPNSAVVTQKKLFEELFLVRDSTRKIKWKITDETREIAGYTCRRANAIMLDSIYVVAFYTTDIPVPGGPESFNGLPGMILGAAIPHENIAWFATKVTDMTIAPGMVAPPKKGKPTDKKGLQATLKNAMQGWGAEGTFNLKAFSL